MERRNKKEINKRLKNIRLIVSDVDGVLTDGKICFDADGKEIKTFHVKDSFRTTIWLESGKSVLWFTGRKAVGTITRAKELGVDLVFKEDVKTGLFEYIKEKYRLEPEEVIYIGDDWNDLYYMQHFGLSATPADAQKENKKIADIITKTNGGYGVLAEIIETLMRAQNSWLPAVEKYLKKFIL